MKKKVYLSLLFMLGMILLPLGVNAEENYSIEASFVGKDSTFKVNGIKEENLTNYFVYICNDSDPAPEKPSSSPTPVENGIMKGWHRVHSSGSSIGHIMISSDWFIYKGYTTAYVLKVATNAEGNTTYTLSEKITINKPELFVPGKGWSFSINDTTWKGSGMVSANFPYDVIKDTLKSKINVKVGMIEDTSIINKFTNHSSDAYSSLLTYAKNDKNGKMTTGVSDTSYFNMGIDKIAEGANYYILITTDLDEGEYRDLTDVIIKTGKSGILSDFSDTGYTTSKTVSTTVKNPNTSDQNILFSILLLAVFSIIGVTSYKKLKNIK